FGEVGVASLGDPQRVVAGLGVVGEQGAHLFGGFQVVAVPGEREPVPALIVGGLHEGGAGVYAQQRFVVVGIFGPGVVQVVRCQERRTDLLRHLQQIRDRAPFDVDAVIHDFAEEGLFREDVGQLLGGGGVLL